jgi:hypothetical protein
LEINGNEIHGAETKMGWIRINLLLRKEILRTKLLLRRASPTPSGAFTLK